MERWSIDNKKHLSNYFYELVSVCGIYGVHDKVLISFEDCILKNKEKYVTTFFPREDEREIGFHLTLYANFLDAKYQSYEGKQVAAYDCEAENLLATAVANSILKGCGNYPVAEFMEGRLARLSVRCVENSRRGVHDGRH